jgi:3-phenylpropionate/cinnamic acid dioxygenase small subunit
MHAYVAVANLIARYAELLDAGDFDGVGALLAHCRLSSQAMQFERNGSEEIAAHFRSVIRLYDDGTPRTKHVTTNVRIEVDDDAGRASGRAYFVVLQEVAGTRQLVPICAGRYEDEFEQVDSTWRFARRHIIRDLDGDLSNHLTRMLA